MVMPKFEYVCKYDFEGFKTFIELKIYTNGKKATTLFLKRKLYVRQ